MLLPIVWHQIQVGTSPQCFFPVWHFLHVFWGCFLCVARCAVVFWPKMEFSLEDFVADPTLEKLDGCNKNNLISIAAQFEIPVVKQDKKEIIKEQIQSALAEKDILPPVEKVSTEAGVGVSDGELRKMELQIEMRRLECDFELRKMELEAAARRESTRVVSQPSSSVSESDFDVNKCIRLIPPFTEKDVDKYFVLFERVAATLSWPKNVWPLLLQCVFTGKAQEAYASLSPEDSLVYDKVKSAVERAYELVPEAYRQKFRRYRKAEGQNYVEFGRDKAALFDRWCAAQNVKEVDQLRDLMVMEEFKNCLCGNATRVTGSFYVRQRHWGNFTPRIII